MFRSIQDFVHVWSAELEATQKIFKHVTNASLTQAISPQARTLGRLAWHITTTIPEMMGRTGLKLAGPDPEAPAPATMKEIFNAYNEAAISLIDQINKQWTDATLEVEDDMYGRKWKRGFTLQSLVFHQIHHRAQMTVLMRQAGLNVPGIYGPSRGEWAAFGMQPPAI